ncbi:hypothetical protein V2J09_004622 [Rumex salicifolius]
MEDSHYSYNFGLSPLYGESFYIQDLDVVDAQHMSINVDLTLPQSDDDLDVTMRWDLRISGIPNPEFEQELVSRLESVYVPLPIRNDVVSKITDVVQSSLHAPTRVWVGVHAIIKLYSNENQTEEEEDDDEDEDERFVYDLDMMISTESTSSGGVLLEALETVRIEGGEREKVCAVCLEEFTVGLEAAKLPCSHVFHGGCVRRWLEKRDTCPLCRYGRRT